MASLRLLLLSLKGRLLLAAVENRGIAVEARPRNAGDPRSCLADSTPASAGTYFPVPSAPQPTCSSAPARPYSGQQLRLIQLNTLTQSIQKVHTDADVCGVSITVDPGSRSRTPCPSECPFYAENTRAAAHCTFVCVNASGCRKVNKMTLVADGDKGICRGCKVAGCLMCASDGTDKCIECREGMTLSDGTCLGKYRFIWRGVYIFAGVLLLLIIGWLTNLMLRPVVNTVGVEHALRFRERCKLHQAVSTTSEFESVASAPSPTASSRRTDTLVARSSTSPLQSMRLWPLSTNLLHEDVAGVGSVLFFNFQISVIVWGVAILLAWLLLSLLTDDDLLFLGLKSVSTPRDYCIVVQWGYHSQQQLSRIKEVFIWAVYVFSSIGALHLTLRNRRIFVEMDDSLATMKDFAVKCSGLPRLEGSEKWEERLQARIQDVTGQEVVGVSICWDYLDCEGPLMAVLQRIQRRAGMCSITSARVQGLNGDEEEPPGGCCDRATQWLHKKEAALLHWITVANSSPPDDIVEVLKSLRSSSKAFAVFRTEGSRDAAVEALEGCGFEFEKRRVTMAATKYEPASIYFQNMCVGGGQKICRLLLGIGVILLALLIWSGAFYLPYASYMLTYTSALGVEPSIMYSTTFSLMVVIGNQIMYFVCREVAERVGFSVHGSMETCYMVLYFVAIVFNVIVDLVVAYRMAYVQMVQGAIRTHDGKLLSEVATGKEVFESYVMQKDLGGKLFSYFFPATALLPFLLEPVMTLFLPLRLMSTMVRRHAEIEPHLAEDLFRAAPIDFGRYADILVNIFLAVLVFLFPGGYTVLTFGALVLSHVYIYCYDHWRVLRVVPSFCVSSCKVSDWSSALLSVPCGILLSTVVFKTNCQGDFPCAPEDRVLYLRCAAAFVLHIVVHLLIMIFIVPFFSRSRLHVAAMESYEECAQQCACSWFTGNPVHCLRSKYIYDHCPPCDFYVAGKEHYMRKNESIGQYFEAQASN